MILRVLDQMFKRVHALLKPATARMDIRPHDEEREFAVFSPDDLRLRRQIGLDIRRIQQPAVFFELLINYLYTKSVNVRFRHQFASFHSDIS